MMDEEEEEEEEEGKRRLIDLHGFAAGKNGPYAYMGNEPNLGTQEY